MKKNLKYQIECDWTINYACNFRCSYCIGVKDKVEKIFTPAQISLAFNNLKKECLIHVTGGEPLLYPKFVDVCRKLTEHHLISINTNLSLPIKEFSRIDPQKIYFFHVSLHYDERKKQDHDFRSFIENINNLRKWNIDFIVSQVISPADFQKYLEIYRYFKKHKIAIHPKYDKNRHFNKSDIKKFIEFASQADRDDGNYESKYSIDLSAKSQQKQLTLENFSEKMCSSGRKFITINPDLSVTRCLEQPLGNLLNGEVKLLKKDSLCGIKAPYCKSFCLKYSYDKKEN